jgi:peptidoglycan/LPS O-acetylase OafA/YrhL
LFLTARAHHESWLGAIPPFDRLAPPLGWRHPAAFGVVCSAMIYLALVCERGLLARLLGATWLRAIGVVSYSFYLVHIDVMHALERAGIDKGAPLFFATFLLTYAGACMMYGLVERRFVVLRTASRSGSAEH